jgi:hypothetical protein
MKTLLKLKKSAENSLFVVSMFNIKYKRLLSIKHCPKSTLEKLLSSSFFQTIFGPLTQNNQRFSRILQILGLIWAKN